MEKKNIILLIILIVIQIIVQVICGQFKQYYHMDEAYSLGLANYDKVEIQDNNDFYNTWHNGKYYEDYLAVQDKDKGNYLPVYENQKNDVHPPLYYLILRFAMGFSVNNFSKWSGIIINIIVYVFITIFLFLILKRLFKNETIALLVAAISSITMGALTSAIYIRMYALSTLNVLIILYLHFRLYEAKDKKNLILALIGISALVGSLTHYYYLFFLGILYIMFIIKYIKEKDYKMCIKYTLTMLIAAVISLLIFPYSIKHLFFGYRGQGAFSKLLGMVTFSGGEQKLTDNIGIISNLVLYINKLSKFAFNYILYILIIPMIVLKCINRKKEKKSNEYIKFIIVPTFVYFIIVVLSSPWIELRYIMPICQLIFCIVIYYLYNLLENVINEDKCNRVIAIVLVATLLMPIPFKLEPEVEYSDKKEIVEFMKTHSNMPTLFLFNANCNRFLDDIYLFSLMENSYVAKNFDCTKEDVSKILLGKDISKGLIIFINEGYNNDEQLLAIKNSMGLNDAKYFKRMNACDVYVMKKTP